MVNRMNKASEKINPLSDIGIALVPTPVTQVPNFQQFAANDAPEEISNLIQQLITEGEVTVGDAISDEGESETITLKECSLEALEDDRAGEVLILSAAGQHKKAAVLSETLLRDTACKLISEAIETVFH